MRPTAVPLRQLGLPEARLFAAQLTAQRELLHHAELDGPGLHP